MAEPTMETLTRRLDRVERENRRLRRAGVVALAVIGAVILMGQARQSVSGEGTREIQAEKFVLRERGGIVRATLSVNTVGTVSLKLSDEAGTPRALFGVSHGGSPSVTFTDGAKPILLLNLYEGLPRLDLTDKKGKVRVSLTVLAQGFPSLRLYDSDKMIRAAFGVSGDGSPILALMDKDKNVIWSAP